SSVFIVDESMLEKDLGPGETTTFQVHFVPAVTGDWSGRALVLLDGVAAPAAEIPMAGSGIQPFVGVRGTVAGCTVDDTPPRWPWLFALAIPAWLFFFRRRE